MKNLVSVPNYIIACKFRNLEDHVYKSLKGTTKQEVQEEERKFSNGTKTKLLLTQMLTFNLMRTPNVKKLVIYRDAFTMNLICLVNLVLIGLHSKI